ncbi:unnamed protein product [Spirodela intermedia]|uniref:Transcription initiation factor TFIID subunit 13 n=1 Tax=Spirodela intermedia TaxID=51605 RepID=A0A7I8I7R6_SPIIN|nr:unnamed protein product [Spirodela intermedia]CAA6653667.1 unnamed protein product [Spirodela intermedia]
MGLRGAHHMVCGFGERDDPNATERAFSSPVRCPVDVFVTEVKHQSYIWEEPYINKSLPETVALVEDIVVEYVTGLTHKAQDIALKRGKLLTEDFLFLIRKLHWCTELLSMNEEPKQAMKAFEIDEEKLLQNEG